MIKKIIFVGFVLISNICLAYVEKPDFITISNDIITSKMKLDFKMGKKEVYGSKESVHKINKIDKRLQASILLQKEFNKKVSYFENEEINCLAKNIYFESRNQDLFGQMAVALVTINRANNPNYSKKICEVVYSQNNGKCAFSWVCFNRKLNINNNLEYMAWNNSLIMARKIYLQKKEFMKLDYTNGALFFYAGKNKPNWVGEKGIIVTAIIGDHLFFKYA